jgi:hypothetical protein
MYSFTILFSALDGDMWSALRPGRFTARETAPGTHYIGGWSWPYLSLLWIEARFLGCQASSLVAIPTEFFRLIILYYLNLGPCTR